MINVDNQNIVILSSQGAELTNVPNIVGLDENNKIVSIGEAPDTIEATAPEEWKRVKDKIHFYNPFSADRFHPELAATTIHFLAYLATHPSPESQKSWLKVSTKLQVKIAGYEEVDANMRELFEYYFQESRFVKVKSLAINNQMKALGKIRQAEWSARFGTLVAPITMAILFLFFVQVVLGEQFLAPIPKDKLLFFFLAFMAVFVFFTYFTSFVFLVIWKFATRNLVSEVISRLIIERFKMSMPKPLMNLIWKKIVFQKWRWLTQRAVDAGDSAPFSGIFYASAFSRLDGVPPSAPAPLTPAVGQFI